MSNLKPAGSAYFNGVSYRLYWDPTNGEIWFTEENSTVRFQMAHIASATKANVENVFLEYLKSQESD